MMLVRNNSLSVVILGDWSKTFIQPEWIAKNVYKMDEIEIGLNGEGTDITISYRANGISIIPNQLRIVFNLEEISDDNLRVFAEYINNFIQSAVTPVPLSYGINIEYFEENDTRFSDIVDTLPDTTEIISNGYIIETTKICRTLKGNNFLLNMEMTAEGNKVIVQFNEHHENIKDVTVDVQSIKQCIERCNKIIEGLEYEIEEEE